MMKQNSTWTRRACWLMGATKNEMDVQPRRITMLVFPRLEKRHQNWRWPQWLAGIMLQASRFPLTSSFRCQHRCRMLKHVVLNVSVTCSMYKRPPQLWCFDSCKWVGCRVVLCFHRQTSWHVWEQGRSYRGWRVGLVALIQITPNDKPCIDVLTL